MDELDKQKITAQQLINGSYANSWFYLSELSDDLTLIEGLDKLTTGEIILEHSGCAERRVQPDFTVYV